MKLNSAILHGYKQHFTKDLYKPQMVIPLGQESYLYRGLPTSLKTCVISSISAVLRLDTAKLP